mmetsp:Transcript_1893/g.3781  ORF Transcript_1893/g.3781 Transcript_1893/m.3781 type:complete len:106 (+) Transcript_1893:1-318(+)
MLSRLASTLGRRGATQAAGRFMGGLGARRNMGGGGGMHESAIHKNMGELFGFVCWFWIFYRAKEDGAVVLGLRHPWEHGHHDDHEDEHHDFESEEVDTLPTNKSH